MDNHKGVLMTSKKNGNSIFIPAAGYATGNGLTYRGTYCKFWSCTPNYWSKVYCFNYNYTTKDTSVSIMLNDMDCVYGLSVRPVAD